MFKKTVTVALLLAVLQSGCSSRLPSEACNPNAACNRMYRPVCGTDGVTYPNQCVFESKTCGGEVNVAHDGECETTPTVACDPNALCTFIYLPVCGTDGVTYPNQCIFKSKTCGGEVNVAHDGECETTPTVACDPNAVCTFIYLPVCGTDGVTYPNQCIFKSKTCGGEVNVAHDGECETTPTVACDPNAVCTFIYQPVCGTDGVTYPNECIFKSKTCGREVNVAHDGECETTPTVACDPNAPCTFIYQPVCGTNGVTYPNQCSLETQTCGQGVTVERQGAC
ncbi:unnamed protein product [Candidula unifasciata]|uniref:Kazal-like domain-containing protein n=1 Tax=Candidula unifasciata TaxID=100452 RepID=A0A8S3ZQ54_9EUPU|nr:unnamed protein product [Candidula unifasciata]